MLKPYYQREGITIFHGDCLDIMPRLIDAGVKVDACITDPPYGIGFKYESHDDTADGYGPWLWSVIEKAESLLLPVSPVFVFQAMLNCREFHDWFPRNFRLFAAAKNFGQIRPCVMQFRWDPVVTWWTDGADGDKPFCEGTLSRDWHIGDVAGTVGRPDAPGYVKGHPCPRPLDQIEHMLIQWCRVGGIAFDPFLGSGTTAVACIRTGRKCLGIEMEEKYCAISAKRCEAEFDRTALIDPVMKAEQHEIKFSDDS